MAISQKKAFRHMEKLDQASALKKRASDIRHKFLKKVICHILDANPDRIQDVVECLESAGFDFSQVVCKSSSPLKSGPSKEDLVDSVVKKEELDDGAGGSDALEDGAAGETGSSPDPLSRRRPGCGIEDMDPKNWVPHRCVRLISTSVPFLVDLMVKVEPVAYSKLALAPLIRIGKKEAKMKALCEHLEYATSVDGEHNLRGDHRHIPTLIAYLIRQRDLEGRRARELCVPAVWAVGEDGIYDLKAEDEAIVVVDKMSGCKHFIPEGDRLCSKDGQPIKIDHLELSENFSAARAKVVSPFCEGHILIVTLGTFGRRGKRLAEVLSAGFVEVAVDKRFKRASEPDDSSVGFEAPADLKTEVVPELKKEIIPAMKTSDSDWTPPVPDELLAAPVVASVDSDIVDDGYAAIPDTECVDRLAAEVKAENHKNAMSESLYHGMADAV